MNRNLFWGTGMLFCTVWFWVWSGALDVPDPFESVVEVTDPHNVLEDHISGPEFLSGALRVDDPILFYRAPDRATKPVHTPESAGTPFCRVRTREGKLVMPEELQAKGLPEGAEIYGTFPCRLWGLFEPEVTYDRNPERRDVPTHRVSTDDRNWQELLDLSIGPDEEGVWDRAARVRSRRILLRVREACSKTYSIEECILNVVWARRLLEAAPVDSDPGK